MSVRLLSKDKELIATAGWVRSYEDFPLESVFQTALDGNTAISDVQLTPEHIPYVSMGAPVVHRGKVRAVLWSELNLKTVWAVIKEIDIGDTGKVFMTDLEGNVIADRNMIHVIRHSAITRPDVLGKLKKAGKAPFSWIEENEGAKFYRLGKSIPNTQWLIILSQTDQETYAYLYRNIYLASLIIGLVCLIAAVTSWRLVRRFLAPLHELHTHVLSIGRGELDSRIDIKSRDEVEDLSTAVNLT